MPEVAGTQNAQAQASQQSTARVGLADNYETFLTLLTTQLANQDPLDPQDSQEFVSQLTAFTGVEQQIALKESMESLLQLQSTSLQMNAVGFMGQKAIILNDTRTLGESGNTDWTYNLSRESYTTKIKVYDDKGKVVAELEGETGAGPHTFSWDGRNEKGERLAPGTYRLGIDAVDSEGETIDFDVRTEGTVTGVDLSGSQVYVEIDNQKVPLGQVVGIKTPASELQMTALGLMDKKVIVNSDSQHLGGNGDVKWSYNLGRNAENTTIKVYNNQGTLLNEYTGAKGAGSHTFSWDGKDFGGDRQPQGVYRIEIVSHDSLGERIEQNVRLDGTVTGVDLSGAQVYVEIGENKFPMSQIVGVKNENSSLFS